MELKLTVEQYLKGVRRMCEHYRSCEDGCPFGNNGCEQDEIEGSDPERAEKLVTNWLVLNPGNTYKSDFYKKFPNALKDSDGYPQACVDDLYSCGECPSHGDCSRCWDREISEVDDLEELDEGED